jgi:restriction system protein
MTVSHSYMVRLGPQGTYLPDCVTGNLIGVDYDIREDLTGQFTDELHPFNAEFIPKWLAVSPGKSKVAAGLACGALWVVGWYIREGDLVVSPDGQGSYRVARVTGPYRYVAESPLPHQRPVEWLPEAILREQMSDALRRSSGAPLAVVNLSGYTDELIALIGGPGPILSVSDPDVVDPAAFALEKHLEDFLVDNWSQTELGKDYAIYSVDGQVVGQQYLTDTGPLDILAVRHDNSELLVVELKKGKASDAVVGQVQRYMGYVRDELAEEGQAVRGVIIALEDDLRIRRALSVTTGIDFYRYEVNFQLHKVGSDE